MAKDLDNDDMALPNGSLLESHEVRLQVVESKTSELVASTAANGVKLEAIAGTLGSIDSKLDGHMAALNSHKTEDAAVALRVHDIEVARSEEKEKKAKRDANLNYGFWTMAAGLGVELCLRFGEHFHILIPK